MRSEIPTPVAVGIIVVLLLIVVGAYWLFFNRKETYQPGAPPSGAQVQELRPMVPGQPPESAPQQSQPTTGIQAQPF